MKTIRNTHCLMGLLALLALGGCAHKLPVTAASMLNTFPPSFAPTGPVARSDGNYRLVRVGEEVTLDAGPSLGLEGTDPLHYRWTISAAPEGSQSRLSRRHYPQAHLQIDKAGTYRLLLEVSDGQSRSDQLPFILSTEAAQLPRSTFVAIGDYGRGSRAQYKVAQAIEGVCEERDCDFILGLGDNIYPAGVKGVEDRKFGSRFELPYANLAQPFYLVLGNHDTSGTMAGSGSYNPRGDIQIAYARSASKPSHRWQMPARYYRIPAPVEETTLPPLVDIYAVDTTLLMSPNDDLTKYDLPQIYERQKLWLNGEKYRSKAQWQLAFAHHPYLSNGRHGNAGSYDHTDILGNGGNMPRINGELVKQFYEEVLCHHMDLVFAGHDHALEYLQPVARCGNTEFIVSGAASSYQEKAMKNRNAVYWQTGNALGFFHIEIVAQTMTVTAYTVDEMTGVAVVGYKRVVEK